MNGKNLLIKIGGVTVAGSTSCEIDSDCETKEIASPNSAKWREYITGRCGWKITCGYLLNATGESIKQVLRVGQKASISVETPDEAHMTGMAIITQVNETGSVGNLAKGAFSFLGTGPLQEAQN